MATFGNDKILIKIEELPVINGMSIESIYRCEYDTRGVKDYTVRPEDSSVYYSLHPRFHTVDSKKYPILHTKKLPKEIAVLFDNIQEVSVRYRDSEESHLRSIKVTSLWYRTSSSGNGSFIDSSIHLSGASLRNSTSSSIDFNRDEKSPYGVQVGSPMAKKLLATLNIKVTVELCKEWEYLYYPSTTIRRIDGWNYPDPVCDGWRWIYGMPYVSLDNKKSMRVFNEKINAHVFLLKVEPDEIQEGEEYIRVDYKHDKEPDKYCYIRSWAHFHEEEPNGMIHHRVDAIKKDKETKEVYAECTVMGQKIKKYRTEQYSLNSFYRIARISNAVNFE